MADQQRRSARLTYAELAGIDLTITALQAAGQTISQVAKDDNPREQMAEAMADLHHPFIELTERDWEIISQIKKLASQLSSRTSLTQLLDVRGKIVQGGTAGRE